jgi:hypothetical protein
MHEIRVTDINWRWSYPLLCAFTLHLGPLRITDCYLFCNLDREQWWTMILAQCSLGNGRARQYHQMVHIDQLQPHTALLNQIVAQVADNAGVDPLKREDLEYVWLRYGNVRVKDGHLISKHGIKKIPTWMKRDWREVKS